MISVCMPYHERRDQLERSLAVYDMLYEDLEISIVDDRSYPSLVPPETRHPIVFSRLDGEKGPKNPCRPINLAVNQSTRPFILLTCPEVKHLTPILGEMLESLESDNHYVIAACKDHDGKWLAHSTTPNFRKSRGPLPAGADMNYCVLFSRVLWEKTGGFDPIYRDGHCYEDADWAWTLADAGATSVMRDDLVTYAQKHPKSGWQRDKIERNKAIFDAKWSHLWNLS